MITFLNNGEVFVFGSNLAGRHGAGAAKQAHDQFGAQYGVGEGATGKCYAFPTLDAKLQKRKPLELVASRERFYDYARKHPEQTFLLTKVGCGLAGYSEFAMRALFQDQPSNVILPGDWK